jgi:mannobiose 2-epimerase
MDLEDYTDDLRAELGNILSYWQNFTVDHQYGGFAGKIGNNNTADLFADKGVVLNARILWSFSAACLYQADPAYLAMAGRAFDYIVSHFMDHEFGGVYWTVDYTGKPADTKKQVYAVAFTIYAFSEYYAVSGDDKAREYAVSLYNDLIRHSYDTVKSGYFEAFSREWMNLPDLRLSEKDANERKTMNTHLHVLEAFANLYKIWPDTGLRIKIEGLLDNFHTHIVDKESGRMILFFDENWERRSSIISYGHDIEASWLILEAAEILAEEDWISRSKELAVKMASACISGLDPDGSLWYENDYENQHLLKEKHWWVQAEAMIGFFNAWQVSGDEGFLHISLRNWHYIKEQIRDTENGEWFWGRLENGQLMAGQDKAGLWKCPYHNSRACLEIIKRIAGMNLNTRFNY